MEKTIDALREGKAIRIAGDTGTLLIGNANDKEVIERFKHLTGFKDRTVLVENVAMLERHVPEFHEICYDLIDTASRPLTIIYPCFQKLPQELGNEKGEIAIRVISDPLLQKLIRSIRSPLLALPNAPNFQAVEHTENDKKFQKEQIIQIGIKGEVRILSM